MRRFAVVLAVSIVLLGAGWTQASLTVSFGDSTTYWAGWSCHSSTDTTYTNNVINGLDHLGVPDLFGGVANMLTINPSTSQLSSITLNYNSAVEGNSVNRLLKYGDLFLDVDSNGTWDYVVRSDVLGTGAYSDSVVQASKTLDVRTFASGIAENSTSSYMLSNSSKTRDGANWSGYVIRYDHPWALTAAAWSNGTSAGTANFSGWQDNALAGSSTYDLGNASINLPVNNGYYNITIGFAPQCANDVLYETIRVSAGSEAVPEPATMIVWSLLGATTWLGMRLRRRRAA
jgi:hypothetical protein